MKYALLIFAVAALVAQSPKPEKIESCGLGQKDAQGHNCRCQERTNNIQNAATNVCRLPDTEWKKLGYKSEDDCLRGQLHGLDHCSIAESFTKYDTESSVSDRGDGDYDMRSSMGEACSRACKKHKCACDDGPVCHFGMTQQEIKEDERGVRKGK